MSEILPRVHRIESVHGGRWLASFLLLGERALLVDSGFATTAAEVILPYLDRCGLASTPLQWLVVTHASGDHFGGNAALKQRWPEMDIVAHEADAPAIASHSRFIAEHIDALRADGIPVPDLRADDPDFLALHGPETQVDCVVQGGERLVLSEDWTVELVRLPGHTAGHLAVYDPLNRALFAGDALMGNGIPDTGGQLSMPPHYFDVDRYLGSINRAQSLSPRHLLATHYLPLADQSVTAFLDESRGFVIRIDEMLLAILRGVERPWDMPALIVTLRARLGIPEADYQYGLLLRAHLARLVQRGCVRVARQSGRSCWLAVPA